MSISVSKDYNAMRPSVKSSYFPQTITAGDTAGDCLYSPNTWEPDKPNTWYDDGYDDNSHNFGWYKVGPPYIPIELNSDYINDKIKNIKEEVKTKMRGVYEVTVVDPRKAGKVLMQRIPVIAVSDTDAFLKAGVGKVVADANLDIEDVDMIAVLIGDEHFIREKKSVNRVKVVKEDDDD